MFDDSQDVGQSVIPNDQPAPAAAAAPVTPASPSTLSVMPPSTDEQPSAFDTSRASPFLAKTNRPVTANESQGQIVSNAVQPDPAHIQAVKRASVLYDVAEALAGGPRYTETIDASGTRTRIPVRLKKGEIAMALALEALSGGLAGMTYGKGRGPGAAGLAGMQQSILRGQQAQQRQDQIAEEDFANRSKALASKAAVAEVNSRTLLNTSEAEKYGADAIDKLVEINRASGVLDVDSDNLDNGGAPLTQAEMLDGIRAGRLNTTDKLGPVAGRVQVTSPDGTTRWESTHLVIRDPNSPVTISQDDWDRYAASHVPGFRPINLGPNGIEVKLSTKQRANEILAAHTLSDFRLNEMREVLSGTPWADKVPTSVNFSEPGVETAISRFQRYVSHSNQHGMDIYESLQAMGTDKRDPKTGQMQPNPDAKYVDTVAGAMGGWPLVEAVHNQLAANKKAATELSIIDSEAKANAVLAAPNRFTKEQQTAAHNFLVLANEQGARKAAQEARSRAVAEGKDVEAMYKTGVNPVTGENLTLANAPDSMLVDAKGRPVPETMQSFYKPSQNERQTADTARQALSISAGLRAAVQKNPSLVGPLLGNSKAALAKMGLGDAEAQKLLDDVAFLQSAATKVHTGRFSNEILRKMSGMIKPGMNTDQFIGGLNSIDEVMQRYAQEDKLVTVADYREMQQSGISEVTAPQNLTNFQVNPQTGQQIGWDGKQWVDVTTRQPVK